MDLHEDFLRRLTAAQPVLYAYLRAHGLRFADADDLMQTLALEIWKNFSAYDPARPFQAWAFGIARNLVLKQRRSERLRRNILVDSTICDAIAAQTEIALLDPAAAFVAERDELAYCLQKLSSPARDFLALRYERRLELAQIAAQTGKTVAAVSMVLTRLRRKLIDCVNQRLARQSLPSIHPPPSPQSP
ncbi:MAG: sigma-70 family RNA polymerase sigma factor [Planctomycetota bacterium]